MRAATGTETILLWCACISAIELCITHTHTKKQQNDHLGYPSFVGLDFISEFGLLYIPTRSPAISMRIAQKSTQSCIVGLVYIYVYVYDDLASKGLLGLALALSTPHPLHPRVDPSEIYLFLPLVVAGRSRREREGRRERERERERERLRRRRLLQHGIPISPLSLDDP